ncbi:MAG: Lpp/OprI family alanine-zipper lipoprotein [Candidatus Methylumidiphilus sp.]
MLKATKLAVILVSAGLTVGCASKGDLDALTSRVVTLESNQSAIKSDVAAAQSTAQDAENKAQQALNTANRTAKDVEGMLNAGFKHKMLK